VFDICGGKGGDISKWYHAGITKLVLADIAENSIKDAIERYNVLAKFENKKDHVKAFSPIFICANCHKISLEKELERLGSAFDFVSCQFALHYSFESDITAKQFIKNIANKLVPGGYFVATFPSANRIVHRITTENKLKFGNDYYSVEFDKKEFPRYGARYKFLLKDAVDNVPEYLVHHDTLMQLTESYDLELVKKSNFTDYYTEQAKDPSLEHLELKVRSGMKGPLDKPFWEIACIYNLYVFRKRGEHQDPQCNWLNKYPDVQESNIIRLADD